MTPGPRFHRSEASEDRRLLILRLWTTLTMILGINYVVWRWVASVNWPAWWISVPLVLAETYSIIDLFLFGMTVWRSRQRADPPTAPDGLSVDVFITTYNEPVDLVLNTVRAASRIRYPHATWVLDDGDRAELRDAAAAGDFGYVTRGEEWAGKPRHAKAGNLNNALLQTTGEYILVLDADMVANPAVLDRTLGYFADDKVALVQTPQYFNNVPPSDPLGSQAPLFYGPIQEGKDGWSASFFCGSNAVLRREALMELGIVGYVNATEKGVITGLKQANSIVRRALRTAPDASTRSALTHTSQAVAVALGAIGSGASIGEATYTLRERIGELSGTVVATDLAAVQAAIRAIDVGRSEEAQALLPMATISVTEDMATSMRLHANGWKSVYHNEILVEGLAPEGLEAALTQRLRWAQGTVQVFLKENPLFLKGLTVPQRLMYFSTMWSYLSGFTTLVYLVAPVLFLTAGVLPVNSYAGPFFWRFLPFMVANQILFVIAARGLPTWRGQQYTLALFPLWIKAGFTAAANVYAGRTLNFAVTPKEGSRSEGLGLGNIRWQLVAAVALIIAVIAGIVRVVLWGAEPIGTLVNVAWVGFDLIALSVLVGAVRYRGYRNDEETE